MLAREIDGAMRSRRLRGVVWAGILALWAALNLSGIALLATGLDRTYFFYATGDALARARVGELLILAGSVAVIAAAGWARWMLTPIWACILVTSPAIVVGGLTLLFENSLMPHLSALVAFSVAFAGLIAGLILARPLLRADFARSALTRRESD